MPRYMDRVKQHRDGGIIRASFGPFSRILVLGIIKSVLPPAFIVMTACIRFHSKSEPLFHAEVFSFCIEAIARCCKTIVRFTESAVSGFLARSISPL